MLAGLFKVLIGSFTKEKILFSGYRLQVWDTFSPGCILTRTAKEYHKREQDGNKKSEKRKRKVNRVSRTRQRRRYGLSGKKPRRTDNCSVFGVAKCKVPSRCSSLTPRWDYPLLGLIERDRPRWRCAGVADTSTRGNAQVQTLAPRRGGTWRRRAVPGPW